MVVAGYKSLLGGVEANDHQFAVVAQLVEQLICNHQVGSSTLSSSTKSGVGVGTQGELIPLLAADYRSRQGSNPCTPTSFDEQSSDTA